MSPSRSSQHIPGHFFCSEQDATRHKATVSSLCIVRSGARCWCIDAFWRQLNVIALLVCLRACSTTHPTYMIPMWLGACLATGISFDSWSMAAGHVSCHAGLPAHGTWTLPFGACRNPVECSTPVCCALCWIATTQPIAAFVAPQLCRQLNPEGSGKQVVCMPHLAAHVHCVVLAKPCVAKPPTTLCASCMFVTGLATSACCP
jgi:lysylphosphatidylglycerol synthetase-like protein (DUF2156 family)